ncbi:MAG: restriction endonuclease [Polynucleobacter sp.]|uniref:restriction endonuclease n=1 Tax=Polynucleobacter sp. TaxID=2029855 RepID=UPI00271805BF|nr:restriction endonuclease [Polynucleobacter sp.]MDO8714455.1 restriction endonuclease [Polynucleobacter sp.]
MKFKMAENSIFAILLRSPWWISFMLVALFGLASFALLPKEYAPFGLMGTVPFVVIGILAAKRQWNTPSPAKVEAELTRLASLSWRDFANVMEPAFTRQGYTVTRLTTGAADFRLEKAGYVTLASCKRYKAASHGVDALQTLVALKETQGAERAIYVSLGPVTAQAGRYAREQGVELISGVGLIKLTAG